MNAPLPPPLSLYDFLAKVKSGQPVAFRETMEIIAAHYHYRPTGFRNGVGADRVDNEAGLNEGSCKTFSFACKHGLSEPETLALFGEYYRDEVLPRPEGQGHRNIRAFMKYGWAGIEFEGEALAER
jgi:hypothetical protein